MMGWTAPISDQNLSSLFLNEFVELTVLQLRAVATSSNYYRLGHWIMFSARFWYILRRKLNFHRTSSEIEYFRSHLEKQLAIDTFLPCQYRPTFQFAAIEVIADAVDKFPRPPIFPHMSSCIKKTNESTNVTLQCRGTTVSTASQRKAVKQDCCLSMRNYYELFSC